MPKNKIKTEWDLTLLYKSEKDPQIEKDVIALEKAYADFEKKYKGKTDYLKDESKLLKALSDWEELTRIAGVWKPIVYLGYKKHLDATNNTVESLSNKLSGRLVSSANKILFFNLNLGKIKETDQKIFLKSNKLKDYHYFLELIFKNSKYNLSEDVEKVLNMKSLPAHVMWTQGQSKLLNIQTVKFEGKDIPLPLALSKLAELPVKKRRKLYDDVMLVLKNISFFAESELNAIYTDKKINDELRGLKEPYSGTILAYQNDEKSILNLIDVVTKNFGVSHRYYKLKAKMMKLPYLECVDKNANIGSINKKLPFADGVRLTEKAFSKIGQKYEDMFNRFLANGQIDVYPKKDKRGGAYCSGMINAPTFVFMNYGDNTDGVMTMAHEMGHAFHFEMSKVQKYIYQEFTTSVAEVASTLFENFAFEEMLETMTPKEKIIALHDRIGDDINTIFRQIAATNWELELHRIVRAEGAITKEKIAELHNKHIKAYLGPVFKMKENDGYTFVQWPHIRYFFYMYSYSYGQLISKALYKKYKEDKSFITQIEKFLSAGGSKSPEDIFKDIGIDTSKPEFFEAGLKSIEDDIKRLEKLAKEARMI